MTSWQQWVFLFMNMESFFICLALKYRWSEFCNFHRTDLVHYSDGFLPYNFWFIWMLMGMRLFVFIILNSACSIVYRKVIDFYETCTPQPCYSNLYQKYFCAPPHFVLNHFICEQDSFIFSLPILDLLFPFPTVLVRSSSMILESSGWEGDILA